MDKSNEPEVDLGCLLEPVPGGAGLSLPLAAGQVN